MSERDYLIAKASRPADPEGYRGSFMNRVPFPGSHANYVYYRDGSLGRRLGQGLAADAAGTAVGAGAGAGAGYLVSLGAKRAGVLPAGRVALKYGGTAGAIAGGFVGRSTMTNRHLDEGVVLARSRRDGKKVKRVNMLGMPRYED